MIEPSVVGDVTSEIGTDSLLSAGVAEIAKQAGLPSRFGGICALAFGLLCGFARYGLAFPAMFHGVAAGLMASGFYEAVKNTGRILREPAEPAEGESK